MDLVVFGLSTFYAEAEKEHQDKTSAFSTVECYTVVSSVDMMHCLDMLRLLLMLIKKNSIQMLD